MIAETVFFAARFANYSNGSRAAGRKLAINPQLYLSCHATRQSDDVDVLLARRRCDDDTEINQLGRHTGLRLKPHCVVS